MILSQTTGDVSIISSFAEILLESDSAVDVCRRIVHFDRAIKDVVGCQILSVTSSSQLRTIGAYGLYPEFDSQSIWSDSAPSKATVTNELTIEKVNKPDFVSMDGVDSAWVTAVPLSSPDIPWGVLTLTSISSPSIESVAPSALTVVSRLGALFLKNGSFVEQIGTTSTVDGADAITERQKTILKLMSEGLTNAHIAKELLLSESSIRQESVKIYRALGVNSRHAATRQAIGLGITPPPPAASGEQTLEPGLVR